MAEKYFIRSKKQKSTRAMSCGKDLMILMLPLIASNILQQLYNTIDSVIISHYTNESSFAAVGIASSIMNLFLFLLVGACTGIAVLFSQYFGAGDLPALRRTCFQASVLGLLFSGALTALGILCLPAIFLLIQVPDTLAPLVRTYLVVVFLGLPATFLYNLCSALLRSVGHTVAVLLVLLISMLVNTGLDLWFVSGLQMGLFGAALATVITQILSAVLSVCILRIRFPQYLFHREDWDMDRGTIHKILRLAVVTALHQSGLYIGKLMVQGIVNGAGESAIAGFTAATRIDGFANSFGDSGSAATSVFVAQAVGAGDRDKREEYYRSSLRILTGMGLLCSAVMALFAPAFCGFLTKAGGASWKDGVSYLRTISLFYLFCFTGNTFAGYFDGIGKAQIPFLGAATHIALRFILSFLLIGRIGLAAVALASGIGWVYANVLWMAIRRHLLKKQQGAGRPDRVRKLRAGKSTALAVEGCQR